MLSWDHVHAAVRPLRWVFWGGLLLVIDVAFTSTTNGQGFRFDILNDTLGAVLITAAVFALARAPVPGAYAPAMTFVKIVAVLSVVETALKHLVFEHPTPLAVVLTVLSLAQLAATIVFCLAMRWFCEAAAIPSVARSWNVTFLLFCVLYALPLGILYAGSLIMMMTGGSFHVNLGAAGLLLLLVLIVPLIHLFVSTSRMKRAAEFGLAGGAEHSPANAFPVLPPRE